MSKPWNDERTCKQCGGPFEPVRGTQLFCKPYCKNKYSRTHKEEWQHVGSYHKICPECGKPFDTPYPFKKYCDKYCKNRVNSRKKYHQNKEHNPEKAQRNRERTNKNHREWRKRKLAEGLCGRCGKYPLVHKTLCGECYKYLKDRYAINR